MFYIYPADYVGVTNVIFEILGVTDAIIFFFTSSMFQYIVIIYLDFSQSIGSFDNLKSF